jgi:pilus assembly protein Flp/PilA
MGLALPLVVTQYGTSGRKAMRPLKEFLQDENGQDLVEYALLASLIAIVSVVSLKVLGGKVSSFWQKLNAQF